MAKPRFEWVVNVEGSTRRFDTKSKAIKTAKRVRRSNPGTTVNVYRRRSSL